MLKLRQVIRLYNQGQCSFSLFPCRIAVSSLDKTGEIVYLCCCTEVLLYEKVTPSVQGGVTGLSHVVDEKGLHKIQAHGSQTTKIPLQREDYKKQRYKYIKANLLLTCIFA